MCLQKEKNNCKRFPLRWYMKSYPFPPFFFPQGYRSLMVSSGTKEGFYKLASNWVNLPLILDNTQKKRAQGQELLRYMYDGGAVQAARARGQRALELRAPLVTIGSNPFFDLQDVKLTAADREQFLFVPFSSRVEDTETLLVRSFR